MSPAGNNFNGIAFYTIDQPVGIINTAAPETAQIALQRFRLADPVKAASSDISQERIDTLQSIFVMDLADVAQRAGTVKEINSIKEKPWALL